MFPPSSISNNLVRQKLNNPPESPVIKDLEALVPSEEKLNQSYTQMVTLINALKPNGTCILTPDFQTELSHLENIMLYNNSFLRIDYSGYNAQIIQYSDNTCEFTINEPINNKNISTAGININCSLTDIYNEIRRLHVIFSFGAGKVLDLSGLDLRNVNLTGYDFTDKQMPYAILDPFKLIATDFTNTNMYKVNFIYPPQNKSIPWNLLLNITPALKSIHDSYSQEKINFVESCLYATEGITTEQALVMKFEIIKSVQIAKQVDDLVNELKKPLYSKSPIINHYLSYLTLPYMTNSSQQEIDDYINTIIKECSKIRTTDNLLTLKINNSVDCYTDELYIEETESEETSSEYYMEEEKDSSNIFCPGDLSNNYTYNYDNLNKVQTQ